MSALPKDLTSLDAELSPQVRQSLQFQERRLKAMFGDSALVIDLISDAILKLLEAKQTYDPEKASWPTYADYVMKLHFYRNAELMAKLEKQGREIAVDKDELLRQEAQNVRVERENPNQRQQLLKIGLQRAMAQQRDCNRWIVADLAIHDRKKVEKDHKITRSQLERKIGLLKESLENEGFNVSDAV